MPYPTRRPPELAGRCFRGSWATSQGLLTPGDLRGPAWQRVWPDVYAPADLVLDHAVRARAALELVPGAVVSGSSALTCWGLDVARAEDDVELVVSPGSPHRRTPGLVVRRRVLDPADVWRLDGLPVLGPGPAVLDLAGRLPLDDGVVLVDRVVQARLAVLGALREAAEVLEGRGCHRVREAVSSADGLAGSPPETWIRLLLKRSALPDPVAQFVVRRGGVFVARVDFAWPAHRLVLEYEGAWHADHLARDRRRLNDLQALGWRVFYVTATDLRDPQALLARIAAALNALRP